MTALDGAILAGGRSERMGRDKFELSLGGRPIVKRIGDAMAPLVERVRVVGVDRPLSGFAAQPDILPGKGPLSGIHAALATAIAPAVIVVACDLPFVTTRFLRGLVDRLDDGVDAVVPRVSGQLVPVCAVYRASCVAPLEARLDDDELAAHRFVEALSARYVENAALAELDPNALCLKNLNTPEDYAEASRIAADEHRQTPD